jgi:monoamine oxidase
MKSPLLTALRRILLEIEHTSFPKPDNHAIASAISRRQFLRTSAQVSCLAALQPTFWRPLVGGIAAPNIAIVGAGLGGLSAAWWLKQNGINTTIFEADQRASGRVRSIHQFGNGNLTTEYGAEFIDTGHTALWSLVDAVGLRAQVLDVNSDKMGEKEAFFFNNRHYSVADIVAELNPIYKKLKRDNKSDRAAMLDKTPLGTYIDQLPVSDWMKQLLHAAYRAENGLETAEQSTLAMLQTIGLKKGEYRPYGESDERYKIRGGNDQIALRMAERMADQINYRHRLIALRELNDQRIQLTFDQQGTTVERTFDAVIMTIPFTILRQIDLKMELPLLKKRVISELAYGANAKLIIETSSRPWRDAGHQGYLTALPFDNSWDSSHLQGENKGVGTITVFSGGMRGRNALRGTETQQLTNIQPVLEAAFPGTVAAFTGRMDTAHWHSNPNSLASYSCFGVGQAIPFEGAAFAPVRNLHFAGEHCSTDFWGFMNGAAETGMRAAKAVSKQ